MLLVNILVAFIFVIIALGNMRHPRLDYALWPGIVAFTYSTAIGSLSWYILPRISPRLSSHRVLVWVQLFFLLTLICFLGGTIAFWLLDATGIVELVYWRSMFVCWIITLLIGFIAAMIEEAKGRLQQTTLELRTRELERERALKLASEARLQSLESRIHPHFLFNTLNSISSLVRTRPAEAEALIERLAELLRFSLDHHGSLVRLADELRITRDYLEIEHTRFGDRLRFSFDIEPGLDEMRVPALSLQTLAENSVKYAVSPSRQGAEVRIAARRAGNDLCLAVTDSGPGFSPDSLPKGHGLDTLEQRLDSFFGSSASLSARRLYPGMEVAFRIPC